MTTKPWHRPLLVAMGILLLAPDASADPDPAPLPPESEADLCAASYEGAQEFMRPNRSESKLLIARASLRTCVRSNCKSWMVNDCSKWLSEVETRIPTVVFSAKNTAGRELTDVKVMTATGRPIVESLDGHAVEMEPGGHHFVFVGADGVRVEKKTIIREGEKAQNVSAMFEAPPGEKPLTPAVAEIPEPTPTIRYVGYGLAATGGVALGFGAIFGLNAIVQKNAANCDAEGACDPGPRGEALAAARISTIAFIAGGVLGAAGVTLIVLSPRHSGAVRRVGASLAPGGMLVGGTW